MNKPILCLDFDGVIHRYSSGWRGVDVIPDPPVDGALAFILQALDHFDVQIFSSRTNQRGGVEAMQRWLQGNFNRYADGGTMHDRQVMEDKISGIKWPTEKPPAFLTIDDRALTFDGTWPTIESLKAFKPWNKREFGATGTFSQGKLNDDDQGDLKIGITYDRLDGVVRVEFGKPVAWLGLPPSQATALAALLLKNAGATP